MGVATGALGKRFLKRDGDTLTGDLAAAPGVTIDGRDISADLLLVVKDADEAISNSNVLQADNELFFPVGANETWAYELFFKASTRRDAAFKWAFTLPTGASGAATFWAEQYLQGTQYPRYQWKADVTSVRRVWVPTGYSTTVNIEMPVREHGLIEVGQNGGNVQLQWAQSIATNAYDSEVKAGGYIVAQRVG